MSIETEILSYLANQKREKPLKYKGLRVGLFGLPDFEHYKYQTIAARFSGLKTKGYIDEKNGSYFITKKGRDFLLKSKSILQKFSTNKTSTDPKDLLIVYDIPEGNKKQRDWFRRQLVSMHFVMIQRSVWVGPAPLSDEFLAYLKSLKLNDNFRTFRLAKGYEIDKR